MRRLIPLISALGVLLGCGGDDGGFTAEQFTGAVNQRGAALELGAQLPSSRADAEVYAVELGDSAAQAGGEAHAGGSLTVMPDDDAGLDEYERCELATSLLCFRADNVVLVLEGEIDPAQIAALEEALRTIAAETG